MTRSVLVTSAKSNVFTNDRNFTSPHTLRVEVGLANEMEQFDKKFKVQQIMGLPRSPSQALSVRKRN